PFPSALSSASAGGIPGPARGLARLLGLLLRVSGAAVDPGPERGTLGLPALRGRPSRPSAAPVIDRARDRHAGPPRRGLHPVHRLSAAEGRAFGPGRSGLAHAARASRALARAPSAAGCPDRLLPLCAALPRALCLDRPPRSVVLPVLRHLRRLDAVLRLRRHARPWMDPGTEARRLRPALAPRALLGRAHRAAALREQLRLRRRPGAAPSPVRPQPAR